MSVSQDNSPLNVVVVGAGIGGLAAALGLSREGHNVRIFEKSKFANEVGAAIVLPPNVYKVLKKLGVNPEDHGSNTEDIRSVYTMTGDLLYENDLTRYGGAARLIHRVDLHEALKGAALAEGVQIELDSPVESVDPTAPSVTLRNGQNIIADVVLGADGIHSVVRNHIATDAPSPSVFHISMFRLLIPCSKLAENPETTRFVNPKGKMTIFLNSDGRRVVNYPCRSNTIMNVAALFPTNLVEENINDEDMKKQMLNIFSEFHPSSVALLELADDVGLWTLYDLPSLSTWSSGRAALLGDAAHPLLPYAAQGGAQALEDAATLTVLLGRGTSKAQVPERLQLYFNIRHGRTDRAQEFSRSDDQSTPNPGVKPKVDPVKFFEEMAKHDSWAFAEERLRVSLPS
jgi:2-polyprenyl-6-methoxyphenol hydroxylase-like FAD-dependent oxidoreductase